MKIYPFRFTEEQVRTLANALLTASIEREDRYKETGDEEYLADKILVDKLRNRALSRLNKGY